MGIGDPLHTRCYQCMVPDYVQPTPKVRPERESIDRASLAQAQQAVDDGAANKVVDLRALTPKSAKAATAKLRTWRTLATRC
eukprot:715871-Amphidinium_carterae.1